MLKLEPVISVEEIIKNDGAPTGQAPIDAVVRVLKSTRCTKVSEVANVLGVNVRDLQAAMRMLTGGEMKELIILWRLKQAKKLLRETDLSYTEVAEQCGYLNPRSMILIFERYEKVTPYTYRTGQIIPNGNYKVNAKYKQIQRQILADLQNEQHEIIRNAKK